MEESKTLDKELHSKDRIKGENNTSGANSLEFMPYCSEFNYNGDTRQWFCSSSNKEFEDFILNEDLINDFTKVL